MDVQTSQVVKSYVTYVTANVCIPDKRFEYEYCTVFLLQ